MVSSMFVFLVQLVLYPVLAFGLLMCARHVYRFFRTHPSLLCSEPCRSQYATAAIVAIAALIMSTGQWSNSSICGLLVLLVYATVLGTAVVHIIAGEKELRSRFAALFDCRCSGTHEADHTAPPSPPAEPPTGVRDDGGTGGTPPAAP